MLLNTLKSLIFNYKIVIALVGKVGFAVSLRAIGSVSAVCIDFSKPENQGSNE